MLKIYWLLVIRYVIPILIITTLSHYSNLLLLFTYGPLLNSEEKTNYVICLKVSTSCILVQTTRVAPISKLADIPITDILAMKSTDTDTDTDTIQFTGSLPRIFLTIKFGQIIIHFIQIASSRHPLYFKSS